VEYTSLLLDSIKLDPILESWIKQVYKLVLIKHLHYTSVMLCLRELPTTSVVEEIAIHYMSTWHISKLFSATASTSKSNHGL
jgi:hypothetical protein